MSENRGILKLNTIHQFFPKNCLSKAIFVSKKRHKKFAYLRYWQIFRYIFSFCKLRYPVEHWCINMPLGVETKARCRYIDSLIENFYKYIDDSNTCRNHLSKLDNLSKPDLGYFLTAQANFNIFSCGSEIKFIIAKFQQSKIFAFLKINAYKLDKQAFIKEMVKFLRTIFLRQETFSINHVKKRLRQKKIKLHFSALLH